MMLSCTLAMCAQEFAASLKLKPDKILSELRQLAAQARPMAASCSSSGGGGGGSGGSSSGSGSNLDGVLELPPDALCRAHMLLTVAQNKFKTFDQVRYTDAPPSSPPLHLPLPPPPSLPLPLTAGQSYNSSIVQHLCVQALFTTLCTAWPMCFCMSCDCTVCFLGPPVCKSAASDTQAVLNTALSGY